ncbi:hypothetical protein HDU83_007877 [Entophlyctis luteolus]|nr:hypothetical protein HDU82_008044 [Entophlyctis luteolus]KAJ3352570.1 hypothetical protein HDU83_007877 [Entophlyctis luteolus]KAJ3385150.1 hypothetical protein HDU84_002428 [Entophlyctis sp. JEL0112]
MSTTASSSPPQSTLPHPQLPTPAPSPPPPSSLASSTSPPNTAPSTTGLPPRPSHAKVVGAVSVTTNAAASQTQPNATASSATPAPAPPSSAEIAKVKKVNFWGWVDVGFSHAVDDYDRTPIETDPLTREGAIEVLNMRLEMRKTTQELLRWREEYEQATQKHAAAQEALAGTATSLSPEPEFLEGEDEDRMQQQQHLRRTQSTMVATEREKDLADLVRRYPPVPPAATGEPKASPLYPHPQYPTQLLPRKKNSSPQLSPPKRAQSMSSVPTLAGTAAGGSSSLDPLPTTHSSAQISAVPVPRPRPQKQMFAGVLERPHSHAGNSTIPQRPQNFALTPSPLAQQKSEEESPVALAAAAPARKRDPSFVAGVAAAAAAGARWTWNEALAREHQKEVEAQQALTGSPTSPPQQGNGNGSGEKTSVIGGLVGFWRGDKHSAKE